MLSYELGGHLIRDAQRRTQHVMHVETVMKHKFVCSNRNWLVTSIYSYEPIISVMDISNDNRKSLFSTAYTEKTRNTGLVPFTAIE